MPSWSSLLSLAHLVGLSLAMGSASVKIVLLLRCKADVTFLPGYLQVSRPITRLIILGMILLTLSGIGWIILGYGLTPRLIAKLVLVAAIWALGPFIDNSIEPRYRTLAPPAGEPASSAFLAHQKRYLTWEIVATSLFYVIVALWVLSS